MKTLSKLIEKKLRNYIKQNEDNSCYLKLQRGWYSTSIKHPRDGGIFFPIENGPIVNFKDKYKRELVGVVYSVSYDTYHKEYDLDIVVWETQFSETDFDFINYLVDLKYCPDIKFNKFDENFFNIKNKNN